MGLMATSAKQQIKEMLQSADVRINGERPWDMQVYNENLYPRIIGKGSLGLGEAYMDGWWECEKLDDFFYRILRVDLHEQVTTSLSFLWNIVKFRVRNPQRTSRAFEVGEHHYDIGNDLYEAMLDSRMVYTCGYWGDGDTLDQAQENKLDIVCRILNLEPGQRVLDIGCGWGSFARYAAEHYGVEVVGITVSKEQAELAEKRTEGLPVEIRLQDYREVNEPFDHIISLGMFEHVGYKNYRTYMETVHRCLDDNGIFVLHTIGGNTSVRHTDPWIEKYIFPNSMIPSIRQIGLAIEDFFVMEDWSNHGPDYDKTLMAWYRNFTENRERLKEHCSDRFQRMWTYYLLSSAGSFRARKNNQWQIVLTKKGRSGRVFVPSFLDKKTQGQFQPRR